jgi:hypothetical protein
MVQTNLQGQQILRSIENFFEAESKRKKPKLCEHCGSSLQFLDAQFQLYGTPMTWKAWLSFCPACESDISIASLPPPSRKRVA